MENFNFSAKLRVCKSDSVRPKSQLPNFGAMTHFYTPRYCEKTSFSSFYGRYTFLESVGKHTKMKYRENMRNSCMPDFVSTTGR